jgi:AcrR family transcriptional regulator
MTTRKPPRRRYTSSARTAAADEKRQCVIDAAGRLLCEEGNVAAVSLNAVAEAAGVTRLTVYNQFGSRRGLLEAVFDERARHGGLGQIPDAMAMPDPRAALDRLIDIFCKFWGGDLAVGRLHDATATDPEFAQAIAERNERRRHAIGVLVFRMTPEAGIRITSQREAIDLIFGLTSYAMYQILRAGRSPRAVCTIVKSACNAALEGLVKGAS